MTIRAAEMVGLEVVAQIRMLTLLPGEAMEAMGQEAAQEPAKEQPPASSAKAPANCTPVAVAAVLIIPHIPMAVTEAVEAVVPIKGLIRNRLPVNLIQVAAEVVAFRAQPLAYMVPQAVRALSA